jgi:hypothetical protein
VTGRIENSGFGGGSAHLDTVKPQVFALLSAGIPPARVFKHFFRCSKNDKGAKAEAFLAEGPAL